MQRSTAETGDREHVKLNRKVQLLSWSTETKSWTLDVLLDGNVAETLRSRSVFMSTGYYGYDNPLQTEISRLKHFKGKRVHPQCWPEDLNYTNKRVTIIGLGATANILLQDGQDSQTCHYLATIPQLHHVGPRGGSRRRYHTRQLPELVCSKTDPNQLDSVPSLYRAFCNWFPTIAQNSIMEATLKTSADGESVDPIFNPTYNSFQKRMRVFPTKTCTRAYATALEAS